MPSRREVAVVTAEAFPADGALPQLPAACDPDHVGRLLAGHLRPPGAVGVERCDLQAVRHRPGRRTVLEYRLTVVTPDGEARPCWPVTGLLFAAPGRARAVARGLDREAAGRGAWPAPLAPVAFLDELDMVVLAYPIDRRLTALPVLAGGPPPPIAAALAARAGADAGAAHVWHTELVRYRPQRAATLRLTLVGDGAPVQRFYAKLRPPGAVAGAGHGWAAGGPFRTAAPLLRAQAGQVAVSPELPGTPLDRWILEGRDARGALEQVADALAALHRGDATRARPARRVPAAGHVAALSRAAADVRWARPDLASALSAIVAATAHALDGGLAAPVHGRLEPDHVLLGADG